jgi:acetyl esterase/lipase
MDGFFEHRGRGFWRRCVRAGVPLALLWAIWLAAPAGAAQQACSGDPTAPLPLHLTVNGADARGLYVLPARQPRALVVFGHGYSYNTDGWRNHMIRTATRDGTLSVTMNYRGLKDLPKDSSGFERSRGWPVKAGSQDLVAAARYFDAACGPFQRIILLGVSMGGNASGLAAASQAKRIDGGPLFDYWVGVEGVYNLTELYQAARVVALSGNTFAQRAQADIEAETGGPYESQPGAYAERTVVQRAGDIAGSGLKGVYVVHGAEDGLAAYNAAQEVTNALRADGLPTDLYTVTKRAPGDTPDTTLAGYANLMTGNAGHGSEWSMHHIVLDTGFDRITASLVRGEPPPCNRNFTVDGTATPTTSPDPATRASGCPAGSRVTPGGSSAGLASGSIVLGTSHLARGCRSLPRLSMRAVLSRRWLTLRGNALPGRCAAAARIVNVRISLARPLGATGRCRFARANGKLTAPRRCTRPIYLRAAGSRRWHLRVRRPSAGVYRLTAITRDTAGQRTRVGQRLPLL